MKFKKNKKWRNKHRTVNMKVNRLYDVFNRYEDGSRPKSAQERYRNGIVLLQSILKEAETLNKKVRVVGSGWSLSQVIHTTDFLVNTKPLNLIVPNLKQEHVMAGIDEKKLVFAQCGASVKELNQVLDNCDKALPTTGASDGQTIAGAVSTGTHGAAVQVGSMPDFVMGIHLITSSKEHFWVEGKEKVMSDQFVETIMPGAIRLNDDLLFQAALISFGSFGIIHGLLLACEDAYKLKVFTKQLEWEKVKKCIDGPDNFHELGLPGDPHHFEVIINPFKMNKVIVNIMYKEYGKFVPPPKPGVQVKMGFGIDLFHIVGALDKLLKNHSDKIMELLDKEFKKRFPEKNGEYGAPRYIFGGSESSVDEPALSIELGFDAKNISSVLDKIFDVAWKNPFVGLISLRYIKGSKATFSFARFPTTCAVEIPSVKSKNSKKFYKLLWERLEKDQVDYSFHWGQMNNLNAENIGRRWTKAAVLSWKNARRTFLTEDRKLKMFSNKFLIDCGLAD